MNITVMGVGLFTPAKLAYIDRLHSGQKYMEKHIHYTDTFAAHRFLQYGRLLHVGIEKATIIKQLSLEESPLQQLNWIALAITEWS
jgi:hypothetical protein